MSDPTALPPSVLAQILTPQASGQSQATAPQPNAQIVELPPELLNQPLTQVVVASVVRQSSKGVLTLQSDLGEIILKTSLSFQPDDSVSVRIQNEQVTLQLFSSADKQPSPLQLFNSEQVVPISLVQITETPNLVVTPLSLEALPRLVEPFVNEIEVTPTAPPVITQSSFTPAAPVPLLSIPQSDESVISNLRVSLPKIETTVPLRTIAAQLPLVAPVHADTDLPLDRAPAQVSIGELHNTVSALRQTQESLLSTQRAGETRAVFVGLTPEQHFPVFQTITDTSQVFALRAPLAEAIPIGTEITLNILQTQNVLPLNVSLPPVNHTLWQNLTEVQETLVHNASSQVVQTFQANIPSPAVPAQISNAVLFFLVAVRSGDAQGWLGDKAVDALKRAGKGDLINRISNEFTMLNRTDSGAGDWRIMSLPLGWNEQIHKVTVFYRKEEERDSDGRQTGTQTRFVMDLSLSAMGKVQLDALFSSASKRLDLIIRTENDFSAAAKQQMRGVYKNALDDTQITGELSFSGSAADWVRVDESAEPEFVEEI